MAANLGVQILMAWPVLIIGLVLIIVGFRGEMDKFEETVREDFTGQPNFLFWVVAVFLVGALGSLKSMRPVSDGFLALIVISLLLSNRGFFAEFSRQINAPSGA
jgi:hypothetical protein